MYHGFTYSEIKKASDAQKLCTSEKDITSRLLQNFINNLHSKKYFNLSVLDIGSGNGEVLEKYLRHIEGLEFDVTVVDSNNEWIESKNGAINRLTNSNIIKIKEVKGHTIDAFSQEGLSSIHGNFNLVIASHVFYHAKGNRLSTIKDQHAKLIKGISEKLLNKSNGIALLIHSESNASEVGDWQELKNKHGYQWPDASCDSVNDNIRNICDDEEITSYSIQFDSHLFFSRKLIHLLEHSPDEVHGILDAPHSLEMLPNDLDEDFSKIALISGCPLPFYKNQMGKEKYKAYIQDVLSKIHKNGGFITRSHSLEIMLPLKIQDINFLFEVENAVNKTINELPEIYKKGIHDTQRRLEKEDKIYTCPTTVLTEDMEKKQVSYDNEDITSTL